MNGIEVFKALGDPTRLKILECVRNGEKCICEIIPETGKRKDGTNIWIHAKDKQIYQIIKETREMNK